MSNPLVKVIALCATEPSVPAGAERVQINLDDAAVAGAMLRLTHLPESPKAVVCAWMPAESVESWVAGLPADAAAYSVEERVVLPITPDRVDAEGRVEGFANIALLRCPAEMEYSDWRRIWQEDHVGPAVDLQATFGYVQNRVLQPLTPNAPAIDAIVEEQFPIEALGDFKAFYGVSTDEEMGQRMTAMLASVVRFGADRDIDVIPMSRFEFVPREVD